MKQPVLFGTPTIVVQNKRSLASSFNRCNNGRGERDEMVGEHWGVNMSVGADSRILILVTLPDSGSCMDSGKGLGP
jgi:hypothetical protein